LRLRTIWFIALLLALPLAACGPVVREQGLPAAEVMRLAAQKSGELQSARFALEADFQIQGISSPATGTAKLNGVLQDGGNAVQFTLAVDARVSPSAEADQPFRLFGNADIVMLPQQETFLRLNMLVTDPEQHLFQASLLDLVAGKWWLLPSQGSASSPVPGGTLTRSPNLLKAQSQVVRVREDDGLTMLDGKKVYHILVELDPEKLLGYLAQVAGERQEPFDRSAAAHTLENLKASGELWVDADTFYLRRVSWDVESLEEENGMTVSGSFTVDLSDHNAAPPIIPPKDASPLSPQLFFGSEVLSSGDRPSVFAFTPVHDSLSLP